MTHFSRLSTHFSSHINHTFHRSLRSLHRPWLITYPTSFVARHSPPSSHICACSSLTCYRSLLITHCSLLVTHCCKTTSGIKLTVQHFAYPSSTNQFYLHGDVVTWLHARRSRTKRVDGVCGRVPPPSWWRRDHRCGVRYQEDWNSAKLWRQVWHSTSAVGRVVVWGGKLG